jgi:predicted ABC-type ATPase
MNSDILQDSPHLVLIAGPNGAGKSTAAPIILREFLGVGEFVNADTIALGLSNFQPEAVAIQAGRVMLRRLHELAAKRVDFAFESTVASRSFAPWITGLKRRGYVFYLVYLWLPSPEMAIARVKARVKMGGHSVPDNVVRRRYIGGRRNFFELYRPLADRWFFYDNAEASGPSLIAEGIYGDVTIVHDYKAWMQISGEVTDAGD